MSQSLTYIEMDIDHCSLVYGTYPCRAHLGLATGGPQVTLFDGTNDYMKRGGTLTGAADSKTLTFSAWLFISSTPSVAHTIVGGVTALNGATTRNQLLIDTAGKLQVIAKNAAGTTILDVKSAVLPTDRWVHVMGSFDLTSTSKRFLYSSDVGSNLATITTYTNDTIDWTVLDWGVGALADGSTKFQGQVAQVWFAPGVYIDLSVTNNRSLFYSSTGLPVDLGATGNTPTGTAPLLYLANPTSAFNVNLGTGGDFTIVGTLSEGNPIFGADRCYNSLGTCQDRASFTNAPVTLRFSQGSEHYPVEIDAIPTIRSVMYTPAQLSLGEDLGIRASLEVTFGDHAWSDAPPGYDDYYKLRSYDPFTQGTYWAKFRARNPFMRGRAIRLIRGQVGDLLATMTTHHLVIESFTGPGPDGVYKVIAKDALKALDEDRAIAPKVNNGYLSASLTTSATSISLLPTGIGDLEYPASGKASIGGTEIVTFTRSGDAMTITRAQLNTTAVTHNAQDVVQLVLEYAAQDVSYIINDLITNYTSVDPAFIPYSDWSTETTTFNRQLYSASIPVPTPVKKLLVELIKQAGLGIWWDDVSKLIRLQVLRQIATDAQVYDEDLYIADKFQVTEQPEKRVSQVLTYFGQINPLVPVDREDNYRSTYYTVDGASEEDYGSSDIMIIHSRWIPPLGRVIAGRLNSLQLGRYRTAPRRMTLSSYRYSADQPSLGGGCLISHRVLQDAAGARVMVPAQIVRLAPEEGSNDIEVEEANFVSLDNEDLNNRTIIIDTDTPNVNLRTAYDTLYPAPASGITVKLIINSGVTVWSTDATVPALVIGSWPAGVTIQIEVRGTLIGMGGRGGDGQTGDAIRAADGQVGGTALQTTVNATLLVAVGGKVLSGGGGGGGCGARVGPDYRGGGGGGGAGRNPGPGGSGPGIAKDGSPGTLNTGGIGGQSYTSDSIFGAADLTNYRGGTGGTPGHDGGDGTTNYGGHPGGDGGLAGYSLDGFSHLTITNNGTITGRTVN